MARSNNYYFLNKDNVIVPSGVFDRRVTFQALLATGQSDGLGGFKTDWQDVISTWAHIEPWRGEEIFLGEQVYPYSRVRVILRYRPSMNLDASMQMLYGARRYNIRWLGVPAEAKRIIELLCEEFQAAGTLH